MNQIPQLNKGLNFWKNIRDFRWLLCSQLFDLRTMWYWYLIHTTFTALFLMVFLVFFVGQVGPERVRFIFIGSLIANMATGMMLSLGQTIGRLKYWNAFEHYAALPISKTIFVAALTMRGVIVAAPSLLIMLMVGGIVLDVWITPAALLILMLGGFTMAGIGAFIGFWSPTGEVAGIATQVVHPFFTFLAPVFFPLEHLPGTLQMVARFIPTTYMAEALRAAMAGRIYGEFWMNILILVAFTVVFLGLMPLKLDWRAR
ncbi:ABC transporter permease [Candidatus Acetothermia bacterium]|nr:ABC transporter permease [Candidatus Acetothermia bacterium]